MKKKIFLLLTLCTLFLSACQSKAPAEQSLAEHGLEIVSLISEMAKSDSYLKLMTSGDLISIAKTIGEGDYSTPKAVYEIVSPDLFSLSAFEDEEATKLLASLPDSLMENINAKSASVLINQLNASDGAEVIAASTLCTAEKLFVDHSLTQNTIYLYTFETGCPIAVQFIKGEDGAVKAMGTPILGSAFSADSINEIQSSLQALFPFQKVEITEIRPL